MNNFNDTMFVALLQKSIDWKSFAEVFEPSGILPKEEFLRFLADELSRQLQNMPKHIEVALTKTLLNENYVVGKVQIEDMIVRIRGEIRWSDEQFSGSISLVPLVTVEEELQEKIKSYRQHVWQLQKWKNTPALVHRGDSNRIVEYLGQVYDEDNWEIVIDYWDHAHCEFCWAKISQGCPDVDYEEGYTDGHSWICPGCFSKYFDA